MVTTSHINFVCSLRLDRGRLGLIEVGNLYTERSSFIKKSYNGSSKCIMSLHLFHSDFCLPRMLYLCNYFRFLFTSQMHMLTVMLFLPFQVRLSPHAVNNRSLEWYSIMLAMKCLLSPIWKLPSNTDHNLYSKMFPLSCMEAFIQDEACLL